MRRSISLATAALATITAATTSRRCQNGIAAYSTRGPPVLLQRQRAAAGEAVLLAVPVADLVLADVPAEENDLVAPPGREVDEALVEVLHLRADLVDSLDAACEL